MGIAGLAIAAAASTVSAAVSAVVTSPSTRATLNAAAERLSPQRGGNLYRPTTEEVARWERKMGRPASLRGGIRIVPRVRCYPWKNATPHIMTDFARLAGETLGIGEAGGVLWAVQANYEGGYGGGGAWNRNTNNVKLYSGLARQAGTPAVYWLRDNVNSEDMYQSFGIPADYNGGEQSLDDNVDAWREAISDNWRRTFGQPHYQNSVATVNGRKLSLMELFRGGYLQQVAVIMGRNDYAAGYNNPAVMTSGYRRMAMLGSYARGGGWPVGSRRVPMVPPVLNIVPVNSAVKTGGRVIVT